MQRKYRLRRNSEFQRTRQEGKCWSHRLLVLCALRNDLSYSRFGFAASRRIGNAVARNRVRRRMREVVRLERQTISPGWDVVLVARAAIAQATYAETTLAVRQLVSRAGLWAARVNADEALG
jgi:ribonuclease P protein component